METPMSPGNVDELVKRYRSLSAAEQVAVSNLLPPPSGGALSTVWIIIVSCLALSVLGFGYLGYQLILQKADATAIVALASTALGALIGLLAPSPAKK
jgi:hypothetical protein